MKLIQKLKMNAKETAIPCIKRYLNAVSVCNSLSLLASKGPYAVYVRRISLLEEIRKRWSQGQDVQLPVTYTETPADNDLIVSSLNESSYSNLCSATVKIEASNSMILTQQYDLESIKEDVKERILEDLQRGSRAGKQLQKQAVTNLRAERQEHRVKSNLLGKQKTKIARKTATSPTSLAASALADSVCLSQNAKVQLGNNKKKIVINTASLTSLDASTLADSVCLSQTTKVQPSVDNPAENDGVNDIDLVCNICNVRMDDHAALKKHKDLEHASGEKYEKMGIFSDNDWNLQDLTLEPIEYKKRAQTCPVCGKNFRTKCDLRKHSSIHSGERPFMCSICGKCFRLKSMLTGHLRIHLDDRRYKCTLCGKSFVQSHGLTDHMATHSRVRTHVCNICGQDFVRSTMLTYHMRRHTGEKPYGCVVCSKRFALSRQLNKHVLIHNDEFQFSCDVCSKKFKFKGGLNRHKRLHLEVRPISCSLCPRTFTQAGNLRVHMRTHTGEKPYTCKDCGQKFSHQPTLKKHQETIH